MDSQEIWYRLFSDLGNCLFIENVATTKLVGNMLQLKNAISVQQSMIANEFIQVITTVNNEKKASEIARMLLETRSAACVQIVGPIASSCWWKGKIMQASEWMCLAKARAKDYERIESIIKDAHPYEVPEILAMPVYFGNPAYLSWIFDETDPR